MPASTGAYVTPGVSATPGELPEAIAELVRACAPPGNHVYEVVVAAGRVAVASAPEGVRRCVDALASVPGLVPDDDGVQYGSVEVVRAASLPTLAFPLARPSGSLADVWSIAADEVGTAPARIAARLGGAGYSDLRWFTFLDGFAIVTAPEKIDASGVPMFRNEPARRFAIDVDVAPTGTRAWLRYMARRVFVEEPVRYRSFVFAASSYAVTNAAAAAQPAAFPGLETAAGHQVPPGLTALLVGRDLRVAAFAYVFERDDEDSVARFVAEVPAELHLRATGLLP